MKCYIRLFYCLLFPVRAFKKNGNRGKRGGVLELENPGGRRVLAVWEIQSEGGGKKCVPLVRGVCIFSGITHCHVRELDNADNEGVADGLPYLEVLKVW